MRHSLYILLASFLPLMANADNISFLDNHVKSVCVQNWDTNGDGELSMEEAAAVAKLSTVFAFDTEIEHFPELQYFTGLTSIGTYDFYSCKNLRSIILPSQITNIETSAFFGCLSLQEIDIPKAVTTISEYAFNGCSSLLYVTFHEGLVTIGDNAFNSCSSLRGIVIPSTVKSIALSAFWSCSALSSIIVDPANTIYDSRDNSNALIHTDTNTLQIGTSNTVIPETVTIIGASAFYGNARLQTIVIPEGVKTIETSAFSGCTALYSVTLPSTLTTIDYGAFSGCKRLSGVVLPEGLKTIGQLAFNNCTSLTEIVIPSTVTYIGMNAFAGISRLTKVVAMNTTPISVFANAFPYRKKSTLYVPKGCREAYANTSTWKDFSNIVELACDIAAAVEPEVIQESVTPTLAISLTNDDFFDYHSITMDITLPRLFSLAAGDIVLSDRCTGMDVTLIPLENNSYRLTCSSESSSLSGTQGLIFTLPLQTTTSIPAGLYKGTVENAALASKYGSMPLDGVDFSWNAVGYAMGDVNHDGDVSLTDVTLLVNYILGLNPAIIYLENADMDYDGEHGLTDVVSIVNIILGN